MEKSTLSQIIIPIIILILFIVGIYGVLRLRDSIAQPPEVTVNVEDEAVVTQETYVVTGTTEAEELYINNNKVEIAEDNSFSYQVPLVVGENTITVKATSNGKTTEFTKTITRTAPVAKTPPATSANDLSDSGPAENIGIVGLAGTILAGYLYTRTRGRKQAKVSYKLFT